MIEEKLREALGCKIGIAGCGRTDTGVHATQFYFYINAPRELPPNFLFFMNKKLPTGVSFLEVIPVQQGARACLDAEARTYDYFFHDFPDALLSRTSSHVDLSKFKLGTVSQVLPWFVQHHDFRAFCLRPDRHNSTLVKFSSVTLFQCPESNRFRIQFVANRFLHGMIRALTKDILNIGNGELTPQEFSAMLNGKAREQKIHLAPPEGLFLTGVSYPYINREPDLPFCGCCAWEKV